MRIALALLLVASVAVAEEHHHDADWGSSLASVAEGAQLFPDLGTLHRPVTTTSKDAQAYFDQGLRLNYGFNHDEAARSFAKAAALDPSCASCWWGVALTLGPNYNMPMLADRGAVAWEALGKARALTATVTPVERALINALASRYKGPVAEGPAAQQKYNERYAKAMEGVARDFANDADVHVLYAEALMDVRPWKLWERGKPAAGTLAIIATLERALRFVPDHVGATHYLIHALEASPHPERALGAAEKLASLMPGAGHLVHMPAHIFQRVGRYADACEANRRAVTVDEKYLARARAPGPYAMYLGHNHGFLSYAAAMIGRSAESKAAARAAVKAVPPEMLEMMPGMDFFAGEIFFALVRFGAWDEILAEPAPLEKYTVLRALYHHARGMAFASLGRADEAKRELAALEKLIKSYAADLGAGLNPARQIAALGAAVVRARMAEKAGALAEATKLWRRAIAIEDKLAYNEPADWFYPLRPFLGAVLLERKQADEAERVFAEDLVRNPANGWALFGRWQALVARGRSSDATVAKGTFDEVWKSADVVLTRAAY